MNNLIYWKGYTISRWVVALAGDDVIGEYDTMAEARKAMKGVPGVRFKYAAAEHINNDGDVNPAVYGETLASATEQLKELLNN